MTRQSKEIRDQAMGKLKQDLAKEMGLWDLIQEGGWGNLSSKDCGRIGGKMGSQFSDSLLRKIAATDETTSMGSDLAAGEQPEDQERR